MTVLLFKVMTAHKYGPEPAFHSKGMQHHGYATLAGGWWWRFHFEMIFDMK
jgi:hypothetical protein